MYNFIDAGAKLLYKTRTILIKNLTDKVLRVFVEFPHKSFDTDIYIGKQQKTRLEFGSNERGVAIVICNAGE